MASRKRTDETPGTEELSGLEAIKEESRGLRGPLDEELWTDASHFTEEGRQILKFHGVYQQDDRDTRRERKRAKEEPDYSMMVRSKIPGGVITAEQYLVHDDLAERFGNGTLRITTRQGFQLHGVLKGDLHGAIRELNEALVTTLGACGDVERNVLSCPAPVSGGLRAEAIELAREISRRTLPRTRAYHEIWLNGDKVVAGDGGTTPAAAEDDPLYGPRYLPRKFKTAIAFPEDNCTDVLSNDLGFVVLSEGGRVRGFEVVVGGGFGMTHNKPETFPRLADRLAFVRPEEAPEVAEAVIRVQRDHGDRTNRRQARLKYLIHRRGIEWFRAQVEEELGRRLTDPEGVPITEIEDHVGWHDQGDGRWFFGLYVENGRIADTDELRLRTAIRDLVEEFGPGVHLTTQQNLLFTDITEARREAFAGALERWDLAGGDRVSTVRRWAMACPALPTCGLAITEAERALPGVLDRLEEELRRLGLDRERFTVRMTGCPNGCARPYTADIAFVGRGLDKYTVFVGGRVVGDRIAFELADLVARDDLVPTLLPLLERFAEHRNDGESFGDFCVRAGVGSVRELAGAVS